METYTILNCTTRLLEWDVAADDDWIGWNEYFINIVFRLNKEACNNWEEEYDVTVNNLQKLVIPEDDLPDNGEFLHYIPKFDVYYYREYVEQNRVTDALVEELQHIYRDGKGSSVIQNQWLINVLKSIDAHWV